MTFEQLKEGIKYLWLLFLAHTRWSKRAVCVMSIGRGLYDDFHDYHDATFPIPSHFHTYECKRCGKEFMI